MIEVWLGQAGSGKTTAVCKEAISTQASDPDGAPVFVLTPDQATFVVEKRLLDASSQGVLTRVQVYHFRRLALRLLTEHRRLPLAMISPAGKYAIFTACFQEERAKLKVLPRNEQDIAYLDRLLKLIEEFQENGTLAALDQLLHQSALSLRLQSKLEDLQRLWQAYEAAIADRFLDPYHLLPQLVNFIQTNPKEVASWTVFIDGFLGFTGQEWQVIEALAEHVGKLVITIGLPPDWAEKNADELIQMTEFTAFAQAVDVLINVQKIADRVTTHLQISQAPGFSRGGRFLSPMLVHLEENMFAAAPTPLKIAAGEWDVTGIRMASAPRMEDEIAGVIRDLFAQKKQFGYRFRDFSVIVTDWDAYRPGLVRALQKAGIAFSMDERTSLASHPLPRLILSIIGWIGQQANEAIEMLKSDLFVLTRDEADHLENALLGSGISLRAWLEAPLSPESRSLEIIKSRLTPILLPFLEQVNTDNLTAATWMRHIWKLLEEVGVNGKLAAWESAYQQSDRTEPNLKHRQVYQLVIRILDDLVLAMEDRLLTSQTIYAQLFHAFHSASTGSIPTHLDEVLVTDVSRVRAFECQVVYLLGCQEGKLPARVSPDDLLGDAERSELLASGQRIAAQSKLRQHFERYRVYMALTRARRQLILSYALQGTDGKGHLPAILLRKWRRDIEGLGIESWDPGEANSDHDYLAYCANPEGAAEKLGVKLSEAQTPEALPLFWKAVYHLFAKGAWTSRVALPHLLGLGHIANSEPLPMDLAKSLYGTQLSGNVSRLERFAACPFAHFVDYGLKAQERKQVRWDARNQGNFVHHVLHEVQKQLTDGEISWVAMSDEQVDEVTKSVFAKAAERFEGGRLVRGGRNQLLAVQLQRTLLRAMRTLTEHARRSEFFPWKLEEKFQYTDPDGRFLLRGRVDRMDLAQDEGEVWFRIIDFKSSERTIDLTKLYYGLSLQLLLYAGVSEDDAAAIIGKKAKFAGMFYFPVYDPRKSQSQLSTPDEAVFALRKATRMKGLIYGDQRIVRLLDKRMESGSEDLFATMVKKNGEFYESAMVVGEVEWEQLKALGYKHASTLSDAVGRGDTRIAPFKLKKETPCTFCQLQSVCAFEAQYHGDLYRRLRPYTRREVLQALGEE